MLEGLPVVSVSELAFDLKSLLEEAFPAVRVRGEISGYTRAASGHGYLSLKDANAVLDAVCWKTTLARLPMQLEDGMEVICTGRMSSYPLRSRYQLVIEHVEAAGQGALLAMLEKRRQALLAEGLFAPERKKPLPVMPRVIGVVTSPTGAVIRDILHRLNDRFPVHVIVWPVLVQGAQAASQIAAAITGFNRMQEKPDLLIVARGGGSLEDLWAFNEEIVVRAAVASTIPLISAVGHETDTTLIDFASDRRAPTPTAAAEIAVPVLADVRYTLQQTYNRLQQQCYRQLVQQQRDLQQLGNRMPPLWQVLALRQQRVDDLGLRLNQAMQRHLLQQQQHLQQQSVLLDSLSHTRVLARGFTYITQPNGHIVTHKQHAASASPLQIHFQDGTLAVNTS